MLPGVVQCHLLDKCTHSMPVQIAVCIGGFRLNELMRNKICHMLVKEAVNDITLNKLSRLQWPDGRR